MVQRLTGRRAALAALLGAVVAMHGWVVQGVAGRMDEIASGGEPVPERMKATYVRTMPRLDPVPAAAGAPNPARSPRRVAVAAVNVPDPVASAPAIAASAVPDPVAAAASSPEPPVAAASAASSPDDRRPFEWPVATRVTYLLSGNYRGELAGTAQVEWLREGSRYQVHLDVVVGLQIAPFMSRRMSSQGQITGDGLKPERYDQETKLPFSQPSRALVRLEPDHVLLANGQRRDRLPGVQDTASQFIQLAWQFSTKPALLKPGAVITVPLAMPRSVAQMQYDVSEPEVLHTLFGEIPVIRLKPRLVPRPGGDLSVEMFLAPQYRYLPMRLVIHQDAETYVDLKITKAPELGS